MLALKKSLYRQVRYHPWTERVQNAVRHEDAVAFPEIDLVVPSGPGDVIIDAGANVGDVTSRCARTGATVHAFEPNPVCAGILERRFSRTPNVTVHNRGVMDRDCSLTLSTPKARGEFDALDTTVGASFFNSDGETETVEVECIDLAGFIRSVGPVALLKMDIEGAEIPVLNRLLDSGTIDLVKMALVETHERFSPELLRATNDLKERIVTSGKQDKIRLDWI